MSVEVKICGITDEAGLHAAIEGGARYVGFVFHPPSPRALSAEAARKLAALVPASVTAVGLFVDPDERELHALLKTVPLGMIQLHGKESPTRVMSVRAITGLPVMKAIGIAAESDLAQIAAYESVADRLLFDAKPSAEAKSPGGNAESFNWALMKGHVFKKPWMLAGGLTAQNLAEAITQSGTRAVDVSSGVEDRPGHKDPAKIAEFLAEAGRL